LGEIPSSPTARSVACLNMLPEPEKRASRQPISAFWDNGWNWR
jgi:hypothetical protein